MTIELNIIGNTLKYSGFQVTRYSEPTNTKFKDILSIDEIIENWCESFGHRPSNINPDECECGMRRFDD